MTYSTRIPWLLLAALPACSSVGSQPGDLNVDPTRAALLELALPATPVVPSDVSNRWADDPLAARFGQRLFFEPRLSGQLLDGDNDGSPESLGQQGETGKVSCAGCHLPEHAFSDTRSIRGQISLGAGWGRRRAPSLLDVAQSKLLMWDGSHDALYNQVFGPIESPVEMNSSRLLAAERVFALHRAEYETVFGPMPPLDDTTRFPALSAKDTGCSLLDEQDRVCRTQARGVPGDGAEYDRMSSADQEAVTRVIVNVGKAMGAYQRLLACGQAPFDRWITGADPNALTPAQVRGAQLFVGKAQCSNCHSGPYLSDEKFHNVGLKPALVATVFLDDNDSGASVGLASTLADPLNVRGKFSDGDDGRMPESIDASMLGAFRTPKLRCVDQRPSFMHTGQMRTLEDVVLFFDYGGDQFGFLGKSELTPLSLSSAERADLVAFLRSLTGPGPSAELRAAP